MATHYRISVILLLGSLVGAASARDEIAFFENEVRPVLVKYCYECHSMESEKLRGELYLDSQPGWQRGGDTGPAIVPGNPDESLVIEAVRYEIDDIAMPPKQKLPQAAIDVLIAWVAMGAPDSRTVEAAPVAPKIDIEEGRKFWSFQPIQQPELPAVKDRSWPRNEIDHFILSRLEEKGLTPASDAVEFTMLRRLSVDLSGLPHNPTNKPGDKPWEMIGIDVSETVDRLLADNHFGERWARHWLDLARYADSSGGGASKLFPDAWQYRDHIIRSFNDDVPFDEIVRRQIAGDLITTETIDERFENLVATGFLVLGPRNYINDDEEAFHMDGADEQLDAVGRVFLGMTMGCARCHDHKFDPIPMDDYYALAGVFTSTETSDLIPATTNFRWNEVSDPRFDPTGEKLADYEASYGRYRTLAKKYSRSQSDPTVSKEEREAINVAKGEAQKAIPKKPAVLMGITDVPAPKDEYRRIRGNPHQSAEVIPRGFLQVTLPSNRSSPPISENQSGRLELANWINSPDNPLTTRVYVNRVWAHLMGRGIVPTVDNFGTTGEEPTHPELLDWLANWFVENDQSTKKLIRLIATSRTYQLGVASGNDSELLEADPSNRLFGRRNRRTLDAETIRDSILSISGSLNLEPVEQPFPGKLKNEFDYSFEGNFKRSIYLPRFRNNLPEIFETFDVANPATVVGKRDLTILSPQALFLMNNPFVQREAKKTARKIQEQNPSDTAEGIRMAYLKTLCREPSAEELGIAREFLDSDEPGSFNLERWAAFQQNLFASVDFRFLR
tara:strand:+ start:1026 stop:3383 length:2358 start_codon:yes stop_codon:yes gene_type:complete